MLPEAAHILQPFLVFLALFGMLYAACWPGGQSDLKAMVAYSSISHMGIVLLGIATLNEVGITGAVIANDCSRPDCRSDVSAGGATL